MRKVVLLSVTTFCIAGGCDSRTDQQKLQGEWLLFEMYGEFDFCPQPAKQDWLPTTMAFTANEFRFTNGKGSRHNLVGTFDCDITHSPKQITFVFDRRTIIGIYDVSTTVLRVCIGEHDNKPPTEFNGGAPVFKTSRPALLLFKRAPKK